jgi:UDP-N-acetylglucosamine 2-epimerase
MIVSVIGTRPQYIKLYPVSKYCKINGIPHGYIDTGQHYDSNMSKRFIDEFHLTDSLDTLKLNHTSPLTQIASGLSQLEPILIRQNASVVVVYGDTTSTLIGALAARKLGLPLAHVESGVRSLKFDQPEETNRVIVDHISHLLFAPTKTAESNLLAEKVGGRVVMSGDLSLDVIRESEKSEVNLSLAFQSFLRKRFLIATFHRPHNVDFEEVLYQLLLELESVEFTVLLFAHPRLKAKLKEFDLRIPQNVNLLEPVGHKELLYLMKHSVGVLTDSGTLQKEAYLLKVVCTTLAKTTEWPETTLHEWNILVELNQQNQLSEAVQRSRPLAYRDGVFGNGKAAETIVSSIVEVLQ